MQFMVYDNGGETADRYTVFPRNREWDATATPSRIGRRGVCAYMRHCLGMSDYPSHPQGFSQFTVGIPGSHLGKRIPFSGLPVEIQRHALARIN